MRNSDYFDPEPDPAPIAPPHAIRCSTHGTWHRVPVCPNCAADERERRSCLEAARIRDGLRREAGQIILCRNGKHLVSVGEQCLECYRARMTRVRAAKALGAKAPKATHCERGHPFTPENTYTSPKSGWRSCRACTKFRDRARYILSREQH